MRVERLELIGFKSFAERTAFDLHPGITCIVGPNGCGKSNVVDSFKWVLGEQSAKSLRGDKMMEVVFDGSASKKPRGMAEVNMFVKGLNGSPEGSTVVTRRLYRSGDSDYLLNRNSCRLKDIKDVFLDTGLELKSYSIFEQDNISKIINSKPEDRRFLIEEVAGVVKYKVRRAEAESKLASSRLNLQRINDIIGEVKRQINSLDRQAKKAERYKKLLEELKVLELKQARSNYLELATKLKESETQLLSIKEKDAALRAELSTLENEHSEKRIRAAEKEKELDLIQENIHTLERRIAEKERLIAVARTEVESYRAHISRVEAEEKEIEEKISATDLRAGQILNEEDNLEKAISSLEEVLSAHDEVLSGARRELEEIEGSIEEARRDLFKVTDELAGVSNELARAELTVTGLRKKGDSLENEIKTEQENLSARKKEQEELEARSNEKRNEASSLNSEKENVSAEVLSLKEQLGSLHEQLRTKRESLAGVLSRADSLREILLDPATKELLGLEDLHIRAALSDVIEASPEYEKAIEAALKELAWGFIVADKAEGVKALRVLRNKNIGRTAFIPLALEGREPRVDKEIPAGAIGRASDFIRTDPPYREIVESLLSNVVIVRELEDIPRANGFTFVTLAGEIFDPRGTFSGGQNKGLLQKKRELRGLEKEIARARAEIEGNEEKASSLSIEISEKETLLARLEGRFRETEKELSIAIHSMQALSEELGRVAKKISWLEMEKGELLKEVSRTEGALALKLEDKGLHEEKKTAREQRIATLQEELSGKKTAFEEERARSVESRMNLNLLKQNLDVLKKELTSVKAQKEEFISKLEHEREERAQTEERIRAKEEETHLLMEGLRQTVKTADEVKEKGQEKRKELEEISAGLLELEGSIKNLRAEIETLGHSLSEYEVRITEFRLKLENLQANIFTTYGIDLANFDTDPPAEGDPERIAELRQKLADIGPVSLSTIDEYEELKTRFEFLNTQREDLERSIAELEEAIKKINTSTRKNLREAYDALNASFGEVFKEFFGGGRAELRLTDENNILETGIDIVAQPPGKKLQNINLLSGGEKSLTALSLLFASFLIKPTPLCVLDEADAALDEPNTVKFAQMVKKLSQTTQFIVITHNRITMEVADYLYGITMQEPGVSKAISMRFAEA